MWIAKNSITGKTYGSTFKSVYDCQAFIDKNLLVLEYEMQRCFALENEVIRGLDHTSFIDLIQDVISSFGKESGLEQDIKIIVEMSLQGKKQKDIDVELHRLAMSRWQKNNVIRCWETSQKRFADGFDF